MHYHIWWCSDLVKSVYVRFNELFELRYLWVVPIVSGDRLGNSVFIFCYCCLFESFQHAVTLTWTRWISLHLTLYFCEIIFSWLFVPQSDCISIISFGSKLIVVEVFQFHVHYTKASRPAIEIYTLSVWNKVAIDYTVLSVNLSQASRSLVKLSTQQCGLFKLSAESALSLFAWTVQTEITYPFKTQCHHTVTLWMFSAIQV